MQRRGIPGDMVLLPLRLRLVSGVTLSLPHASASKERSSVSTATRPPTHISTAHPRVAPRYTLTGPVIDLYFCLVGFLA